MKFAQNKFALSAAATWGIMYIACTIVVAPVPSFALKLLGWLAHLVNVDQFATEITVGGVLIGLGEVLVYSYIAAFIFAWLYNRLVKD